MKRPAWGRGTNPSRATSRANGAKRPPSVWKSWWPSSISTTGPVPGAKAGDGTGGENVVSGTCWAGAGGAIRRASSAVANQGLGAARRGRDADMGSSRTGERGSGAGRIETTPGGMLLSSAGTAQTALRPLW